MNKLKKVVVLAAVGLSLIPVAASAGAKSQAFFCGAGHHVRAGGSEMRSTAVGLRNADLNNPMTIERITVRNVFGAIVHDSGPAVGVAHPLNTDFATPLDITVVPPGGSYYLRTNHIWGNSGFPVTAGGNEAGQSITVTVEVSKDGKGELVKISTRGRSRDRIFTPSGTVVEGAERSSNSSSCDLID